MDDDRGDLARRVFAAATAMLEDAIDLAVAGQSPRLDARELVALGHRLRAAAKDIAVIAEAAAIVAGPGFERPRGRQNRTR